MPTPPLRVMPVIMIVALFLTYVNPVFCSYAFALTRVKSNFCTISQAVIVTNTEIFKFFHVREILHLVKCEIGFGALRFSVALSIIMTLKQIQTKQNYVQSDSLTYYFFVRFFYLLNKKIYIMHFCFMKIKMQASQNHK